MAVRKKTKLPSEEPVVVCVGGLGVVLETSEAEGWN